MNRRRPLLPERSLEITLTVPLIPRRGIEREGGEGQGLFKYGFQGVGSHCLKTIKSMRIRIIELHRIKAKENID